MLSLHKETLSSVSCGFLISLNCSDHFHVDPAFVPLSATGYQLVTLCRSVCVEERAQILDPLMRIKYFITFFIALVAFLSSLYFSCLKN